jgi:deoxycytidylate deaminase
MAVRSTTPISMSPTRPCIHCMKVLINTGLRTIFYDRPYKLDTVRDLLRHAAIKLVQVKPEVPDAPA